MAITTIEGAIMAALFARLAALSLSPSMPIAYPNISFAPPSDQKYLRVQFVPNTANRVVIDSDGPSQFVGLLQVSVYWTKNKGESDPREIAGKIADWFAADTKLTSGAVTVRLAKRPDVRDLIVEEAAVQIPVLIAWEVYA